MRKLVAPALILAAVSVAAPSMAQSYHRPAPPPPHHGPQHAGYGAWQSINARQANLDRRIDRASAPASSAAAKPSACAASSTACCGWKPTTAGAA